MTGRPCARFSGRLRHRLAAARSQGRDTGRVRELPCRRDDSIDTDPPSRAQPADRVHFGDGSHRALGPRELDLVRRRQQAEHSTVGQYREKYRQTARGWRIAYFSEQNLFNSPRRRSVVAPASAMATCEYALSGRAYAELPKRLPNCLARRSRCSRRRSDVMLPPAKPAGTLLLARSTTSKCWINSSARTPGGMPIQRGIR